MPDERLADGLEPMGSGPHLAAAFLCERVLQEVDGTTSFIRVVDRWTSRASDPDAPEEMPRISVNWNLVLLWKAGEARGRSEATVDIEAPSGVSLGDTVRFPLLWEGADRGVQIVVQLGLQLNEEGLYWMNVRLDRRPVTRVPFRLVWERLGPAGPRR